MNVRLYRYGVIWRKKIYITFREYYYMINREYGTTFASQA